jgi:hypothetical protein
MCASWMRPGRSRSLPCWVAWAWRTGSAWWETTISFPRWCRTLPLLSRAWTAACSGASVRRTPRHVCFSLPLCFPPCLLLPFWAQGFARCLSCSGKPADALMRCLGTACGDVTFHALSNPKQEVLDGRVHVQAVVTLRSQYRMCADIMAIANELTYEGQLWCGSPLVEHGMLSVSDDKPESAPGWLRQVSSCLPCTSLRAADFPCLTGY